MKKCPVCGKEWSDATRFCGSCGAKLEDGNIVVPDIVPDDGKEEQRKKTEPVKPSVKKTIEPVRPKTGETAENKKIAEEKEEEKNTAERKRAEYNKSDAVLPVKRRKKGWKKRAVKTGAITLPPRPEQWILRKNITGISRKNITTTPGSRNAAVQCWISIKKTVNRSFYGRAFSIRIPTILLRPHGTPCIRAENLPFRLSCPASMKTAPASTS